MSEKLLEIIDFRDTVPYSPNAGSVNCSILLKEAERSKDALTSPGCLNPEIPCFECPLAQRVRNYAEFAFEIARTPYGLTEHRSRRYGGGENLLRTEEGAQTRALRVGDVLVTGERLISNPRVGANGIVWLHLNGRFIGVPSRLPIALNDPFALPSDLKLGNTLLTGDKVLSDPKVGENGIVWLLLSGGLNGHLIDVPGSIPIALCTSNRSDRDAAVK